MKPYVICNDRNTEYWSNDLGWVGIDDATRFSAADITRLSLPIGGRWITLWEIDTLQFARFIAECEACYVFADTDRLNQVADSMDLDIDEVCELIDRATQQWDKYKTRL
jgi:hypothetical protein